VALAANSEDWEPGAVGGAHYLRFLHKCETFLCNSLRNK